MKEKLFLKYLLLVLLCFCYGSYGADNLIANTTSGFVRGTTSFHGTHRVFSFYLLLNEKSIKLIILLID